MSVFVILKVLHRNFNLSMPVATVKKLKDEFLFLCEEDQTLKQQLLNHDGSFDFVSPRPELIGTHMSDWEFVLRENEEIQNLQVVTVRFSSKPYEIIPEVNKISQQSSGSGSTAQVLSPTPAVPPSQGTVSERISEGAASEMPVIQENCSNYEKLKQFYKKSEWEQLSDYEKKNENELMEKHFLLQEMDLIPKDEVFTPSKRGCPSKKSTNVSNSKKKSAPKTKPAASRVPTRKSSRILANPTKYSEEIDETDDDIFFDDQGGKGESSNFTKPVELPTLEALQKEWKPLTFDDDDVTGQNNVSAAEDRTHEITTSTAEEDREDNDTQQLQYGVAETSTHTAEQNKENMSPPQKKRRRQYIKKARAGYGRELTKRNALPKFPTKLIMGLKQNNYKMSELLMSIRHHVASKLGPGVYPSSDEYDILSEALIKQYKYLADDPEAGGFTWIRERIRKTLSNETRRNNAKSSIEPEVHQVIQEEQAEVSSTTCPFEMELQSWNSELTNNRKLFLIRRTFDQRLNSIPIDSSLLGQYLQKYPHYMEGTMMLFEYSLFMKETSPNEVSFSDLQANAVLCFHKLLQHFKVPDITQALELLQAKLIPAKYQKEHIAMLFSAVHINEAHGDRSTLYTNHDVQSPCVLLVTDVEEGDKPIIKRTILKMGKGMISSIVDPSPSIAVLHLMAPYFLFDSYYPTAYESLLRFLEKQIHGFLCRHTLTRKRPKKEFVDFMKEFGE